MKLVNEDALDIEDGNIFHKNKLHIHKPKRFDSEIIKILDWGDTITEMEWDKFLFEYPKAHAGFIAIAKSGKLGFLETHEGHPKDSKHYYILIAWVLIEHFESYQSQLLKSWAEIVVRYILNVQSLSLHLKHIPS